MRLHGVFNTVHLSLIPCSADDVIFRLPSRYVRSAVLPCVETGRCLFRTRGSLPQDVVEVNEVFSMQISHGALRQKTLRVDVCNTSKSGHEGCLVSGRLLGFSGVGHLGDATI